MTKPVDQAAAPPGWSYNPSAWSQRLPIVALAVLGLVIASYLAAFQFNLLGTVWDPFFGSGSSIKILTSPVSNLLPIPDAALGALGYLVDAGSGILGGKKRWRTMPWIVVVFGLAVGPLGAISIVLVIIQPVLFNAWCTLCLVTALISVLMIGPALDEMLASLQHLKRVADRGGSLWNAFWGVDTVLPPAEPEPLTRGRLDAGRHLARHLEPDEGEE